MTTRFVLFAVLREPVSLLRRAGERHWCGVSASCTLAAVASLCDLIGCQVEVAHSARVLWCKLVCVSCPILRCIFLCFVWFLLAYLQLRFQEMTTAVLADTKQAARLPVSVPLSAPAVTGGESSDGPLFVHFQASLTAFRFSCCLESSLALTLLWLPKRRALVPCGHPCCDVGMRTCFSRRCPFRSSLRPFNCSGTTVIGRGRPWSKLLASDGTRS